MSPRPRASGVTWVMQAAALLLLGLGGTVLYGWFTRDADLIRLTPSFPPMQANAAVCYAVAGLGLLFHLDGRRPYLLGCGVLVGLLGLLTLVEYGFGMDLQIDQLVARPLAGVRGPHPARMSAFTAVGLVLAGSGFVWMSRPVRPRQGEAVLGTAGAVVMALGVGALVVYGVGLDVGGWGGSGWRQMPVFGAIGLVGLGMALGAAAWQETPAGEVGVPRWIPIPVAAGVATLSVVLSMALAASHRAQVEVEARRHLGSVRLALETGVRERIQRIERLGQQWGSGAEAELAWEREAAQVVGQIPGCQGIGRADRALQIRQLLPLRENESLTNVSLAGRQANHVAAGTAQRDRMPVFTPSQPLPQGGEGFLVFGPLGRGEAADGWVVGFFRPVPFFSALLSAVTEPGHAVALREGEREAFSFNPEGSDRVWLGAQEAEWELAGVTWTVRVSPTAARTQLQADKAALAIGWVAALLLGGSVHLAQKARRQAREWVANNRRLADEIIERRRTEEALRESEARHRAVFESSADAIVTADGEGRLETLNPAAERLFGYAAAELVGQGAVRLLAPPLGEATEAEVRAFLAGPVEEVVGNQQEVLARRRDGSCFPADLALAEIQLGGRRLFTGVVRDVSERKKAEAELASARDAALESARLKSEFLANMSHEIRTPMNGVMGMTNLLLETELTPTQRDFTETIHNSAEALLTIINDILDFSKIEAGKLTMETIDFGVRDLVEECLEMLAPRAQGKGLELIGRCEDAVPVRLRGDPGRLRQILTNLVGNAIKFTAQGEIEVTVGREAGTGEGSGGVVLRFAVRDTGPGIAAEAQRRLFLAFSQADGSTTRRHGGTGLGLAICRQLVEMMDGEIGVASVPGEGSTFWFTARLQPPSTSSPPAEGPQDLLVGAHVLVVDDNAAQRRALGAWCRGWRMRDEAAAGAGEAMALLQTAQEAGDPMRVVLVDLGMPGVDGWELAGQIRGRSDLFQPALVLLTPVHRRPEEEMLRRQGVTAALIKPVRQAQLLELLNTVLGASGVGEGTPVGVRVTPRAPGERKTTRVLVAEDNPTNLKVALFQLEQLGYGADSVGNGVEALALLQRVPYDVVLMDCMMPEMDGFEATRQIRQLEARSGGPGWSNVRADRRGRIRIIAMTANAMKGDRDRCLAAGMDDYVSKPVRLPELQAALERAERGLSPAAKETAAEALAPEVASWQEGLPELDADVLAELRALPASGERDSLVELITVFLDDAPSRLAKLLQAIEQGDREGVVRMAHLLKGSVGGMGARRCSALFGQLEEKARGGAAEGWEALFEQAAARFGAVCRELEAERRARLETR